MKAFELMGEVDEQHQLHVQVPRECAPGKVRVVVVPENGAEAEAAEDDWQKLNDLIQACQMDAGIADLAHEHDHYRLGTPKKNDYKAPQ